MKLRRRVLPISIILFISLSLNSAEAQQRKRARDLGLDIGILQPGKWNAITDVEGVKVGHQTLVKGDNIRTGITVIFPHDGDIFNEKVPGAVFVGNGYGKAIGFTQVEELGNIETPIGLTGTLNIWTVANGIVRYVINLPGNEFIKSINPVVGETNDSFLNDIRGEHITVDDVLKAIKNAKTGPVEEGCVGAGTGTSCFGFKGGIGTSSRILPKELGRYTVGVLVQTNFGGVLNINGAPVGRELGVYNVPESMCKKKDSDQDYDGSCMIVIATDAPLFSRNLKRLAKRSFLAFGIVGAWSSNSSGDYAIAFSTNPQNRIRDVDPFNREKEKSIEYPTRVIINSGMSTLFQAVVEATVEAMYNSLFMARDVTGCGNTREALPLDKTMDILKKYNVLNWNKKLDPCKE